MLPGIEVFLDVDDLHDIGALEQYVSESAVVLIFLSRGYFGSRNCMREVRAMCEMHKPVILLHEADESKGGLPFQQAVDECPSEYRPCLFDGRASIPWTRIKEFQRFTLLLVAERGFSEKALLSVAAGARTPVKSKVPERPGFESRQYNWP